MNEANKTVRLLDKLIENEHGLYSEPEIRVFENMKNSIEEAKRYGTRIFVKMAASVQQLLDEYHTA